MEKPGLQKVFDAYTAGKKEMDNKTFVKIFKDGNLLDKKLTSNALDILFAKVRGNSSVKNISFAQFQNGIKEAAKEKGTSEEDLTKTVSALQGPQFAGTKADNVKFHDDKTTYTGTHVVNAIEKEEEKKAEKPQDEKKMKQEVVSQGQPAGSLQEVFNAFTQGQAEMDGKTFAKFAKDCQVLDKKCTTTDVDLTFNKVKGNASIRKINFGQFQTAIEQLATKKGIDNKVLVEHILAKGGPVFKGTKADYNKFHDDKSTFTGVHQHGGPSTVDKDKISDIKQICDRTGADVRGVKK